MALPNPPRHRRRPWALAPILLLSAALNLYHLGQIGIRGVGNYYYAAGVQSMLTGPRHFFFLSFDPAGFLSMDKAPLALWLQAASARLLGFRGLSLLLPQALAGVASVYLLYHLVRRSHGRRAGLWAALALALMPISVVTNRNNTPDALLVLALLLAADAILRALERDSLPWLLAGAAWVGVAFNVKMLQLLLVAPALALLVLWGTPWPWPKRLRRAGLALLVALLVAAPWVLAVELTPPAQRPYVGGSDNNSAIDLVLGYNGLDRLWSKDWSALLGPPSPWRLLNDKLAGQASWLLPLALAGLALAAVRLRSASTSPPPPAALRSTPGGRRAEDSLNRRRALLLWPAWLAVPLLYFSLATFYHRYYLATMAPAVAALAGIGAEALWQAWEQGGRARLWPPLALLGSAAIQVLFLLFYPDWGRWLIPPLLLLALPAAGLLLAAWRRPALAGSRWPQLALHAGLLALFLAPAVWAGIPVLTCTDYTMPYAGPQQRACEDLLSRPFLDPALADYLLRERQGATFLAATYDLSIAGLGILQTGQPFMALGGYRGSDPILTVGQFAERVASGEVRFFLSISEQAETLAQEDLRAWVRAHCFLAPVQSQGVIVRGPCTTGP